MTSISQAPHDLHFIIFQPESYEFVFLFRANSVLYEKTSHHVFGRGMITVGKEAHDFIFIQFRWNVNSFIHHLISFDDAKLPVARINDVTHKWEVRTNFTDFLCVLFGYSIEIMYFCM